jgi:hypothetical protein
VGVERSDAIPAGHLAEFRRLVRAVSERQGQIAATLSRQLVDGRFAESEHALEQCVRRYADHVTDADSGHLRRRFADCSAHLEHHLLYLLKGMSPARGDIIGINARSLNVMRHSSFA